MPKILFNAREQLLTEAKRQINEKGYAATTMRSVAGACGFAVGTMYNYFESKEVLISMYVAEDWKLHLEAMSTLPTDCRKALLRSRCGKGFAQQLYGKAHRTPRPACGHYSTRLLGT